jgi:hypothetical protein
MAGSRRTSDAMSMDARTGDGDSVEALSERIVGLVQERQELRAGAAEASELERNRRELALLQQRLSRALIRRHLAATA